MDIKDFDHLINAKLNEIGEEDFAPPVGRWERFHDQLKEQQEFEDRSSWGAWFKDNAMLIAIALLLLSNGFFIYEWFTTKKEVKNLSSKVLFLEEEVETCGQNLTTSTQLLTSLQTEQKKNTEKLNQQPSSKMIQPEAKTIVKYVYLPAPTINTTDKSINTNESPLQNDNKTTLTQTNPVSVANSTTGNQRIVPNNALVVSKEDVAVIAAILHKHADKQDTPNDEIPISSKDALAINTILEKAAKEAEDDKILIEIDKTNNAIVKTIKTTNPIEPTVEKKTELVRNIEDYNKIYDGLANIPIYVIGEMPDTIQQLEFEKIPMKASFRDQMIRLGMAVTPKSYEVGLTFGGGGITRAIGDFNSSYQVGIGGEVTFFEWLRLGAGVGYTNQLFTLSNIEQGNYDDFIASFPDMTPNDPADIPTQAKIYYNSVDIPLTARFLLQPKRNFSPYLGLGLIGRWHYSQVPEYYFLTAPNHTIEYEVYGTSQTGGFSFNNWSTMIGGSGILNRKWRYFIEGYYQRTGANQTIDNQQANLFGLQGGLMMQLGGSGNRKKGVYNPFSN